MAVFVQAGGRVPSRTAVSCLSRLLLPCEALDGKGGEDSRSRLAMGIPDKSLAAVFTEET
ncbi:hypothetical protein E2C01_087412 [Portunus trituberculatus]|uniref:Uncharacterized protein n=1 Tax=Portunus trituberculatus TaxID=210409 RepID=A0A5B7JBR9_PORTR|nr:hypothetical protein [Portunus trituberculatus]